ncbi:MAG: type II toxin-antitoxin system RelE/ParE family toxin [Spirochaetales bacterium]|nr:type II toxin-antitoxin system RelE/ParE family toxin [Spirochaetales bacterium]
MMKILWSEDASQDLLDIVSYIKDRSGSTMAREIYSRIQEKVKKSNSFPDSHRVAPELAEIGIAEIKEIIESPWRIFYRISNDEMRILSVVDGRRNVEEVLYRKIIEGKMH